MNCCAIYKMAIDADHAQERVALSFLHRFSPFLLIKVVISIIVCQLSILI